MLPDSLKVIYKYVLEEDPQIVKRCLKIAGLLGKFINTSVILPLVISHLTDKESKNLPRYVSSCLAVLSEVISNLSAQSLDPHLAEVTNLLTNADYFESENKEVLICVLRLVKNIVEIGPPSISEEAIRT